MEITRTATIPCPRDTLFEYLRDPDNDPKWCSTVHESELDEGVRAEPGAVYQQKHKPGPFPPSALQVTLLDIDPPDHIRLRSDDDIGTFVVTYRLEDMGDGTTQVTQHDDIRFRGFGHLLAPFISLAVKSGVKRQFDDLREMAESGVIAPTA